MAQEDEKLALDTQLLEVCLTSLQVEVEAKVRDLHRFREQMQKLDRGASGKMNIIDQERAVCALIAQVDRMIDTNVVVRDLLEHLRSAAKSVLQDLPSANDRAGL
jgi:hypothetical protein